MTALADPRPPEGADRDADVRKGIAVLRQTATNRRAAGSPMGDVIDRYADALEAALRAASAPEAGRSMTDEERAAVREFRRRGATRCDPVSAPDDAAALVDSGTYGELPAEVRAMISGHEWDNMTRDEQRAWLIRALAAARARRPEEWDMEVERLTLKQAARAVCLGCREGWRLATESSQPQATYPEHAGWHYLPKGAAAGACKALPILALLAKVPSDTF